MKPALLLALVSCLFLRSADAQNSFFQKWEDRVRATTARQPAWPIPVIAPSSQLVQLYRFDLLRQITSTRFTTVNLDNAKGLNLIPFKATEIDITLPPFLLHNNPKVKDGAGDFSIVAKFRPFASPSEAHNFSLGGQMIFTVPTGSYKNGAAVSTLQPTLMGGKGYGKFAVQSTLGATLPTSSGLTLGRPVAWNTTAQYKVGKIFWPEIESNALFFHGGPNDGRIQNFLSPGIMVSRVKFRKDPRNRLSLVFGGSMQIATSSYHAYNHALVFTSRVGF